MSTRGAAVRVALIGVAAIWLFVACGGSDGNRPPIALPTTTERTTTTGGGTSTTNAPTTTEAPSTTERTTTTRPTTTERTTTTEAPTTTTTERTTTTEATTTTQEETSTIEAPAGEETTTTEAVSSEAGPAVEPVAATGDTRWVWMVLILLVIAAIVALVVGHRKAEKKSNATWSQNVRRAATEGQLVCDELRHGAAGGPEAEPMMGRRLRTLDATLSGLRPGAPSEVDRQSIDVALAVLRELVNALDGDVRLRIGPPPPTEDQLATSRALITQRALDLDTALERLASTSDARS